MDLARDGNLEELYQHLREYDSDAINKILSLKLPKMDGSKRLSIREQLGQDIFRELIKPTLSSYPPDSPINEQLPDESEQHSLCDLAKYAGEKDNFQLLLTKLSQYTPYTIKKIVKIKPSKSDGTRRLSIEEQIGYLPEFMKNQFRDRLL